MSIFSKMAGDYSARHIKKTNSIIEEINKLEKKFESFSDQDLRNETNRFKERIKTGELLDDILPEAFAVVREASKKNLKQRHYDVQLIGGIVLHQGKIAEMKTGEGKTLAATLPLYLNALTGEGAHLVTVNDYLAKRDAVWMGQIFYALGLSTACIVHDNAFIYDSEYMQEVQKSPASTSETGRAKVPSSDKRSEAGKMQNLDEKRDEIGGFKIQPAELIKPILIIYLASWLAKYEEIKDASIAKVKKHAIKKISGFIFVLLFISILIMLGPDMGTTLIICLTALSVFFLSSTNIMQTLGTLSVALAGFLVGIIAIVMEPYRLERMTTYLQLILHGEVPDPRGAGYQLHQILIGIGSSGFWGKGFGQSRQRFGYLVENTAFTDSTFAVVLEELGLLSAVIIIGLWIFFFFKGYQIAKNAPDKQGRLLAIGITIWLTLQTLLNIAANIGIIPITGLPLPFFTYGGSSTIVTFVGIAMLLNISRYSNVNISSNKNIYGKIKY